MGFSLTFRTLGLVSDATKYIVPSTYEYRTPATSGLLAADDVATVQNECRSIARRTSRRCLSSPPGIATSRLDSNTIRPPLGARRTLDI
jgi:hypothetical protein